MNGQEKANLQDELIGASIGLARASDGHEPATSTHKAMIEGLFTTLTNVNLTRKRFCLRLIPSDRNEMLSFPDAMPAHPLAAEMMRTI